MNKLDRYILKGFLSTLVFSVLALCVIFLVVNLMESLDGFLDHNASIEAICLYYLYYLPQIIKLIFPIAMLLASLFSIGRLSGANEITAMKSAGLSLYRLMVPIVIVSITISIGQLYFNGWVVPPAQTKMISIDRQYLGKVSGASETQLYNLYFRDDEHRNVIFGSYDSKTKSGNEITVEDYAGELQPRLSRRIDAKRFAWDSTQVLWMVMNGYERVAGADGKTVVRYFAQDTLHLKMSHKSITELQRTTDEMNFDELHEYISILESGGKDVRIKRIDYYGQFAFPFADLIVVLFGVPFASVRKKGGIAVEMAAAMIVAFTYLVFTKISQSIGFEMNLQPQIVAWSANSLFLIIALLNLFRTKT